MSFSPMLAATAQALDGLQYPLLGSPKLDGIRAVVREGRLLSRNLKPIPNPHTQRLFRELEGHDGELIVGDPTAPTCFRATASGVMAKQGSPDVIFWVFDHFLEPSQPFTKRLKQLRSGHPAVELVPQRLLRDKDELLAYEEDLLGQGHEGVMLRAPEGRYKHGRSSLLEGLLIKLKRFEDAEAVVIGVTELFHNQNEATKSPTGHQVRSSKQGGLVPSGVMGALQVRGLSGRHRHQLFNIGSGFDQAQRAELWERHKQGLVEGMVVTYKYFPSGSKEAPRFPVFKGFRPDLA